MRASVCHGIHSCAHVQFHVHMRVLPSTCACKHVRRHALMCASCTRVCIRSLRAHVRASMRNGVTAYIHVCTHACASEHICVHVQFNVHMLVLPSTCPCTHVRRHTLMCASCAHAGASEHMCAQACVTAYIHVRTCGIMFTCVCFRAQCNFMYTCVYFRARVRASMCGSVHSCVHHVHMHACASEHMHVHPSTCMCIRAHVSANIRDGVTAYIHVCTPACASEHMCVHVQFHVHLGVLPSTCTCKHVRRHTLMCASCAHAGASEHMCAQACVTAYIHVRTCGIMFTCACYRGHVRAPATSCAHACTSEHMCVQACVS